MLILGMEPQDWIQVEVFKPVTFKIVATEIRLGKCRLGFEAPRELVRILRAGLVDPKDAFPPKFTHETKRRR